MMFTEYKLPRGEQNLVEYKRPDQIEALAAEVVAKGYRFECELLTNGTFSFTAAGPSERDGDIAIKLCRDKNFIPSTIDLLVKETHMKVIGNRDSPRRRLPRRRG